MSPTSTAHAQVSAEVRKAEELIGFADIVERVKLVGDALKVNIAEKAASKDEDPNNNDEIPPFQPGHRRSVLQALRLGDGSPRPARWYRGGCCSASVRVGLLQPADGFLAATKQRRGRRAEKRSKSTTNYGKTDTRKASCTIKRTTCADQGRRPQRPPVRQLPTASPGSAMGAGGRHEGRPRWAGDGGYRRPAAATLAVVVMTIHRDRRTGEQGQLGQPCSIRQRSDGGQDTAMIPPSGGSVGTCSKSGIDGQKVIGAASSRRAVSRGWIGVQIQRRRPKIADSLARERPKARGRGNWRAMDSRQRLASSPAT